MKTNDGRVRAAGVLVLLIVTAVTTVLSTDVARGQDSDPGDITIEELASSIDRAESELDRARADAKRELNRLTARRAADISAAEARATGAIQSIEGTISNEVQEVQAKANERIDELERARRELDATVTDLRATVASIEVSTTRSVEDLADARARLEEALERQGVAEQQLTTRRETLAASAVAAYLAGNSSSLESTFDVDEFTEARRAVLYSEQLLDDRIGAVSEADGRRADAVADGESARADETGAIEQIDDLAAELRTTAQQIRSAAEAREQVSADIVTITAERDLAVAGLRRELATARKRILADLASERTAINSGHDSAAGTVSRDLDRQIADRSAALSAQRRELGQRRLDAELAAINAESAASGTSAGQAAGSNSTTPAPGAQGTSRAPAGAGSSALASAANREAAESSRQTSTTFDSPVAVAGQQARPTTTTVRAPILSNKPAAATISALGFPQVSLNAFERAANAHPRCGLRWQVLAGISKVESNHGRIFGSSVASDGTTTKMILGPVLDGSRGFLAIPDTDNGRHDLDTVWDRAVGPMQFIPSSWRIYGADADRNGRSDPHDVDDAAMAAANLLCRWGPGLEHEAALRAAVLHYNRSVVYGNEVIGWALAYERIRPGPEPVLLSRVVTPPTPPTTTTTTTSTTTSSIPSDSSTTSTTAETGTSQDATTTSTTGTPADILPFLDTTPTSSPAPTIVTTTTAPPTTTPPTTPSPTSTTATSSTVTSTTTTSSGPAPSIVIVEPLGPG